MTAIDPDYVARLEAEVALLRAASQPLTDGVKLVLPPNVELSAKVLRLLSVIAAGGGEPVSTERAYAALYAGVSEPASVSTVKVMVNTLRIKLKGWCEVKSRRNFGYSITQDAIQKLLGKEPWNA